MRIATGIIETYQGEDYNLGPSTEYCITSIADDFNMSPAERAALTANHAVTLPDLASGLTVQIDHEPEDYSCCEWYSVDDDRNVVRTSEQPFSLGNLLSGRLYVRQQF